MNLYAVLILAIIFTENKANVHIHSKDALPQGGLHKTAAQLAKLIHLVSGYANVESGLNEEEEVTEEDQRADTSDLTPFDLDYFLVRNKPHARKKPISLQGKSQPYRPEVRLDLAYQSPGAKLHLARPGPGVRPSQANQNIGVSPLQAYHSSRVQLQPEGPEEKPHQTNQGKGTRLHLIRNPRVLEEYQKRLWKPAKLYQVSDGTDVSSTDSKNSMLDQRRNAVFRLDTASVEDTPKPTNTDNLKTKHDIPKLFKVKKRNQNTRFDDKNNDVDIYLEEDNRKKGREDDSLKQDNAWDVITKKYDWSDKHSDQYENTPRNKKETQKKIKKGKFDNWNNKVTKQDFDRWDKKTTKPDTYDDWPKKEKNNKWNSLEKKPQEKKDFDNSYEKPKKERKNTDWDVTVFKLSIPKTTRKWKQEIKDDWDKAYAPKISSYNNPRNKKSRDSFDSGGFFGRTPIPYVGRHGIYVDN